MEGRAIEAGGAIQAGGALQARFRGALGRFALDAAFSAPGRGITALFGPSGAGKTTLLRCVAGLSRLEDGFFALEGEIWQDGARFLPPHRRAIGYVFQEASLFAHLSIKDNLLYGHRRALKAGAVEAIRYDEAVALLGIAPLLDRPPSALSGGERQRVAIGRALLSQPRLLLMDEPLAALDRRSKAEILPYLERLRDALAIPALYVSHDLAEVERLAAHLVLLEGGRVVASGPLAALQSDPSLPIARMPEASVTLPATIDAFDAAYGLTRLTLEGGALLMPGRVGAVGETRRLRVAAADVSLARRPPEESTVLNALPAMILGAERLDAAQMIVALTLGAEGGGARFLARITRRSWDALGLGPGQSVFAQIKGAALAAEPPPEPSEASTKGDRASQS